MENHTDIETLLTKYFEGNTTPPENEQIEAWLNADEEHLRIAKQLNTLYLAVDTQHITKKIDTEKALDKVKKQNKKLETCPGGDGHNALRPSCPFPS